ncbi:Crp/Fnr family transcriptional regulator [Agriterribacter sp.]|uniref:Crp/Fnr family transcriptional regulator n=1 Tax=Agriterribacter sp. TaxID=2821509 RepID=UPI002BA07F0F|nr:Crp/Fnr family transcriptional regulator [Agriterribacter sp.]HTN05596.1 Crp/Fnr family transcriptional regulator [Agriterribacter sp.]
MFYIFRKYLEDKITLTNEDYELIESVSLFKKLRKRQYLLQAGDISRFHAFVCKGFLRYYYVDEKGQEHIMQFAPENHWTGDFESMNYGLPSKYDIDAIEESEILLLKKEDFEMIRKTIPAFNDFVNETLKKNAVVLQKRIHANIALSAEEKYSDFISKYPSISNRVPLHMIASYLGLSAETLSRVRSQSTRK